MQRPVVIFLHIGKTAGTTIRQILRRQYAPSETLLVRNRPLRGVGEDGRPTREATVPYFASLPETQRARPSLILGHVIFGLHGFVPRPSTYFTVLRDPVALTISQYNYVARNPNHPLHGDAAYRSLESYVTSGVTLESDNSQTRAISGDTSAPFGGCTSDMLERAKKNVEAHFSVVGLVERFDETLLLLRDAFGWKNPYYVRANVTPQSRKDAVTPGARRLIEEQNRFDVELYAWASGRFEDAIARSPRFAAELERFRRANRRHAPWGRVTYTIPKLVAGRLRRG